MAGGGNDAGQVTVIATESGGSCGTSVLTITQNTVDDWMIGSARYNNGTSLMPLHRPTAAFPGSTATSPTAASSSTATSPTASRSTAASSRPRTRRASPRSTAAPRARTATGRPRRMVRSRRSRTRRSRRAASATRISRTSSSTARSPKAGTSTRRPRPELRRRGDMLRRRRRGIWHYFHRWSDITPDELPGVICYLRSLTPQAQAGHVELRRLLPP